MSQIPAKTQGKLRTPLALQHPGFGRLSVAWVFTNLADSALYLMVAVWVKDLTGSDTSAGFVFVALGIPAILAPFIGMVADRVSRKLLLVANNAALVVIVLALLLVQNPTHLWLVYTVVMLYSAGSYVTSAAQSGLIHSMLPTAHLASGNGILTSIDNGLRLVSPLLGTALYVLRGPQAVVVLTAMCFGIAGVILAFLPTEAPHVQDVTDPGTETKLRRYTRVLTAGFSHLFRKLVLRNLTLSIAIAFGATGLINIAIFPKLDELGVPAAAIGWLVPLQGAGALVGGLLSAMLVTRLGEAASVALGLSLLGVGFVPFMLDSLLLLAAGCVVAGFGIPITVVAYSTIRQRLTSNDLQGRAAAAANVAINVPQTLLTMAGAAMLAVLDVRTIMAITMALIFLGGLLAFKTRRGVTD